MTQWECINMKSIGFIITHSLLWCLTAVEKDKLGKGKSDESLKMYLLFWEKKNQNIDSR